MKNILLPPGKLGLGVEFHSNKGGAVITAIHPTCTFADMIEVGDQLMLIDGKPIFSIKDIIVGNNRVRKLGIKPVTTPAADDDDDQQQGGGDATKAQHIIERPKHSVNYSADEPPIKVRQAYNFFTFEMRVKLQEGAFDNDPKQNNMSMSQRWNLLSKEQKAPYERMVAMDKERYHREMARYLRKMNNRDGIYDDCGNNNGDDGDGTKNPYARKYLTMPSATGSTRVRTKIAKDDCDNNDELSSSGSYDAKDSNDDDDNDPDWQLKEDRSKKRKRQKMESEYCVLPDEKSYQISRCTSMKKLDRSVIYLETLIRAKSAELRRVKQRREYLKSIEPIPRVECSLDGCTNKGLGGGLCRKHGGTKLRRTLICSAEGCTNRARTIEGGVCYRHGSTPRKRCNYPAGCNSYAKAGGRCMRHATTKPKHYYCKVEGCGKKSQMAGLCAKHGAPIPRCSVEGCDSYAKKGWRGGLCARHAEESITTSVLGGA